MSIEATREQFKDPSERFDSAEFHQLKDRLDRAQLEQTVAALHDSLPASKAKDAEETMRRMFERAKRWEK